MDSDVSKKNSGLLSAFKSSIAKTRRPENQLVDSNQNNASSRTIQVIKHTDDIADFNAERISVAIGKAFLAIEASEYHIHVLTDRVANLGISIKQLHTIINAYFKSGLFSIQGALKRTAASQALSVFKKLKEITSSVIFTSTRNFSIQKNLSISA